MERVVREAVAEAIDPALEHEVRFSHHTDLGRLVAFQRLCHLSGMAYLSQTSHLCIHPRFGPWTALRAVVLVAVETAAPAGQETADLEAGADWGGGDNNAGEEEKAGHSSSVLGAASSAHSTPSGAVSGAPTAPKAPPLLPCPVTAAMEAEATERMTPALDAAKSGSAEAWKSWLAVRDAYQSDSWDAHRYSDEQILYHYTKDRAILSAAVRAGRQQRLVAAAGA